MATETETILKAIRGTKCFDPRRDLSASIVVFLVALPLCMGIAIASGVPVSAGLVTGIVAGIIVGPISGCPLQVSGPAAGLTVIVYEAVERYGLASLGAIVLLAGMLQIVAGMLRLGQWFRAVSPAVVHGMLAGIGVLIIAGQFHVMLDDKPHGHGLKNLIAIPQSIVKAARIPSVPGRDDRQNQRNALLRLAELHRRQQSIHDRLAERLPDQAGDAEAVGAVDVRALVEAQQSLIDDMRRFVADQRHQFSADPGRHDRLLAAESRAVEAMSNSLALLQSAHPADAIRMEDEASRALLEIQSVFRVHELAAGVGVLTIITLVLWTAFARGSLKIVPAPLIAVVVASVAAACWQLPILYVEIPASITEELHVLNPGRLNWSPLFFSGLGLAVIASAETLLSASAVDQMHRGPRTRYDRELLAQGVGNMLCGVLGALPMTGVIVRSSANVQAGAVSRLSATLHGIWLLVFVLFLGTVLRMIPTSALAAILVYTGYKLCDPKKVRELARYGWSEVVIYSATVLVIVAEDLLTGVLIGFGLAIAKLLLSVAHLHVHVAADNEGIVNVTLAGAGTFLRIPKLASRLERIPPGVPVTIHLNELDYLDHACLMHLSTWCELHRSSGGEVRVDWNDLNALVRNGRGNSLAENVARSGERVTPAK